MSIFRIHHSLEAETPWHPTMVADNLVRGLARNLWTRHRRELKNCELLADKLVDRANRSFQKSAIFREQLKSSDGLDRLYFSMRHWLVEYLKEENEVIYRLIPQDYLEEMVTQRRERA